VPDGRDELLFIDHALSGQRQLQVLQLGLAVGVILLGVAVLVAAQLLSTGLTTGSLQALGSIGGVFVGSLSAFPLVQRRSRGFSISALELLRARWQRLAAGELTPDEAANLRDTFDKFWKAGLTA
jgi:hypothetical protein